MWIIKNHENNTLSGVANDQLIFTNDMNKNNWITFETYKKAYRLLRETKRSKWNNYQIIFYCNHQKQTIKYEKN